MIHGDHLLIISLLTIVLAPPLFCAANNSSSTGCHRFCGNTPVDYPFGFSDGCRIRLNCSGDREWRIGDFRVLNVTYEQVLISLPIQCNRSIGELTQLFGANFAPTWRNELLLENCSELVNDCLIPNRLLRPEHCNVRNGYNRSCYTVGNDDGVEFLSYENVTRRGNCRVLLSSIMVDSRGSVVSSISVDTETVELGWWLNGACDCAPNSNCTQVQYGGQMGYRCNCNDGFIGNGFSAGIGCRRASDCSASGSYIQGRCRRSKVGILVGGIIAGAMSMIILIIICYHVKKRTTTLKNRMSTKRLITEAVGRSPIPLYPYREIERATNGFSENQMLGTGAYGTVYAGKLHNDEWVAIKKLKHRGNESVQQVMNEIKLLSSVSHTNLVRLMGCSFENAEQILVYEYMPNGTLAQHLQRERGCTLPWTVRLTIATETAHAIAYLHSSVNPPIYHRDIKSSNILLDYNFISKVADFGLSRSGMTDDGSKSHVSTAPQGTPGYVDPQYHQNFHLSDKCDVYSFGVVLVEIISAMKVVDFSRPRSDVNLAALAVDRIGKGRVDEIIDPFIEQNGDDWTLSSVLKVAELAFRCLAFDWDMRPSMIEVAEELEMIRLSGWAPLEKNVEQMGSSRASSCSSSPFIGSSDKSLSTSTTKKMVTVGSQRSAMTTTVPENKQSSLVSVQDPCLSQHSSSPSSNILLCNGTETELTTPGHETQC